MINRIHNINCMDLMEEMKRKGVKVDAVLTSPFYNTNKKAGKGKTLMNSKVKQDNYHYLRYDKFVDNMSDEEYNDFTRELFNSIDEILVKDGVILYNISYGSENTNGMFLAINEIITKTNFIIADVITWKKHTAMPNSSSPNKLTRITEFVFVFARIGELGSFKTNKRVTSVRDSGQRMYENVTNFVEAKNNDGSCPYNKATYSSELCEKLMNIYIEEGSLVFDPFMGSGTTAIACINKDMEYIGAELSAKQCEWAENRILRHNSQITLEI